MNRLLFLLAVLFVSPAFAFTPWFCAGNKLKDGFYHSGGYGYECKNGATKNLCEGREGVKVRIDGVVKRCEGGAVVNLPVDRPGLRPDPEHCMDRNCLTWSGDSGGGSSGGGSSGGGSSSGGGRSSSGGESLEIVDIPGQQPPKSSGGGSSGSNDSNIGPVGGWLGDKEAEEQSKQKAREEKERQEKEKKQGGGNVPDPSAPPGNTGGSYQGYPFGKKELESAKRLMEALKAHQKRWADKWTDIANEANAIKTNLADELSRCDFYHKNNPKTYEDCVKAAVSNAAEKSKKLNEKIEVFKRMQAIEEKALNEQIQELNPISKLIVNAFSGFTIPDGSSSSKTTEKTGDDKNGTTKETETITEKTSDGGGNGGGVVNNYNTQTNNITTTNNQTINNEIVNKIETRDYSGAINSLNESLNNLNSSIQGQTASLNQNLNGGFAGLAGKLGEISEKIDKLSKGDGQAGDGKNGSGKGEGSSSGDKKGDGKAEEGYQGNPEWDRVKNSVRSVIALLPCNLIFR